MGEARAESTKWLYVQVWSNIYVIYIEVYIVIYNS